MNKPASDADQTIDAGRIAALARDYRRANGPVMALVTRLGGSLESQIAMIPEAYRARVEVITARALVASYDLAAQGARLPDMGARGPLVAAMVSGAAGGAGGIATSMAELPVTITVILHAIQREAKAAGYDPAESWVRAECLRVFGAGSPLASDDGINTSFLSARLTLTGPALQKLVATVAPKLAAALGQKLMAQAVPVLGAATGAALNVAFVRYYAEVARIRFALMRMAELHGTDAVLARFAKEVAGARIKTA
jgi:EcsC protein family